MNMNKILRYGMGVLGILLVSAFTAVMVTTVPVRVIGPYFTSTQPFDSAGINQFGGHVQTYIAGDTVRVGHIVYISARNQVKESATLSDYNAVAGVVVGGTRTNGQASVSIADTSSIAAILGQRVFVMDVGRFWVVDSGGGKSPGARVRPSGTKGRMALVTTAIDSAYRVIGRTVDTTVTGTATLVQIHVK